MAYWRVPMVVMICTPSTRRLLDAATAPRWRDETPAATPMAHVRACLVIFFV